PGRSPSASNAMDGRKRPRVDLSRRRERGFAVATDPTRIECSERNEKSPHRLALRLAAPAPADRIVPARDADRRDALSVGRLGNAFQRRLLAAASERRTVRGQGATAVLADQPGLD